MITVHTFKAQPIGDVPTVNSEITIIEECPPFTTLKNQDEVFENEAIRIHAALYASLPGGVYDQLARLFLECKASHLRVRHHRFEGEIPQEFEDEIPQETK